LGGFKTLRTFYLKRDGNLYLAPEKNRRLRPAVLYCLLGLIIGMSLQAFIAAHPDFFAGLFLAIKNICLAIWDMLCDAAHACSSFIRYLISMKSQ
jgi:hypothetical protein